MLAPAWLRFQRHYNEQDLVIIPVILLIVLGVNWLDKKTKRKP